MTSNHETFIIDPEAYFRGWAYHIRPEQYPALGVRVRFIIDKEKTEPARKQAIAAGYSRKDAVERIRIFRRELVIDPDHEYDFREGDIFYPASSGTMGWLQVVKVWSDQDQRLIEVHLQQGQARRAFHASAAQLACALMSGNMPEAAQHIDRAQSKSESLRFSITTN